MVVEYMLLLLISSMILIGAFGVDTGPVAMFKENAPYLAKQVENNLETGRGFLDSAKANQIQWQN